MIRYDISYPLKDKELTVEEADTVFSTIANQLEFEINNTKNKIR